MKTSQWIGVAGMLTVCLSACGSNPPKPVLPDGSHRVPVNATPPAAPPAVSPAVSPVVSPVVSPEISSAVFPAMSPTATGAQP
jgi:hypothetical protein